MGDMGDSGAAEKVGNSAAAVGRPKLPVNGLSVAGLPKVMAAMERMSMRPEPSVTWAGAAAAVGFALEE